MPPSRHHRRGFFERIGDSMVAAGVGVLFIIGATFLLFLNEGAAVARYNALAEGESAVRSINPVR